jgi:formylglycine-generating enzyme required for sulfatase activity
MIFFKDKITEYCVLYIPLIACLLLPSISIASVDVAKLKAGEVFRECPNCPEMVVVPAGIFTMGSSDADTARDLAAVPDFAIDFARRVLPDEHPEHIVSIGQPFAIGKYPVTRREFAIFVKETGYSIDGPCTIHLNHKFLYPSDSDWQKPGFTQTDEDPVVCVSWNDAQAYVTWLNKKISSGNATYLESYRLPTEAEWEYAVRGGTKTARWWGDDVGSNNAICDVCGSKWDNKQTAPVGSFRPNPFGLFDMLGNVWQWTEDCWHPDYIDAPKDGSAWISGKWCEARMVRGADWSSDSWVLRSAERTRLYITKRGNFLGFRIVKNMFK